jgi:hypothetical protein
VLRQDGDVELVVSPRRIADAERRDAGVRIPNRPSEDRSLLRERREEGKPDETRRERMAERKRRGDSER